MGGGGWWVVVAWSNLVSAQGPLVLGLGLRVWGQGLTINTDLQSLRGLEDLHGLRPDLGLHRRVLRDDQRLSSYPET